MLAFKFFFNAQLLQSNLEDECKLTEKNFSIENSTSKTLVILPMPFSKTVPNKAKY
jgi:hypothetical protein